jgi:hypothetical protein
LNVYSRAINTHVHQNNGLIMKILLLSSFFLCLTASIIAQQHFFTAKGQNTLLKSSSGTREIVPQKYYAYSVNNIELKNFLLYLPSEGAIASNRSAAPQLMIPMPDGSLEKFRVWESAIMEPGLAAKFPEIKTFSGQGIDDPYATIQFDYNPYTGFHAQILSAAKGRVFIDPYAKGDLSSCISYNASDYKSEAKMECKIIETSVKKNIGDDLAAPQAACLGSTLRKYRLALACTGEYAVAVCRPNTANAAQTAAAMVTSLNRVNGVYEKELAIRMLLVNNNDKLIYLNGSSDPYSNSNGGAMLDENQANLDNVIGSSNYDIGHVFSTGGGGVARLNSPCNNSVKAQGVTGRANPVGDPFDIDYVAHEIGHQFGSPHTFNSSTDNCGGNRSGGMAYEVGSGISIMAYAGICGADNIQPNSIPYFHTASIDRISNHVNGSGNCATNTPTGNNLPVINPLPNNGVSIPVSTPFILSGTATDIDGDALTYSWEQFDLGTAGTWNSGATAAENNTVPLFTPKEPKITGERMFPDIKVILAGYPANPASATNGLKGETLSPVARAMNFRLTVRDNRAGGGAVVSSGSGACQTQTVYQINVTGTKPFVVTYPNVTGISWDGGSTQTITWDVANTNAAPVNCANVAIELSTDGGLTYPTTILASTPNDGSETITVPDNPTQTARIRVKALNNVFFNISNNNFTILQSTNPSFDFITPAAATSTCGAATPPVVELSTTQRLGFSASINLSALAAGIPAGTSVGFSANPVKPGDKVNVTLNNANTLSPGNYDITIQGVSGSITRTRVVRFIIAPGGAGPVITTNPFALGACIGTNVNFTAAANAALSQQWQISTDRGNSWTDIAGQTQLNYTINNISASVNNNLYRCVFKGICNNSTTTPAQLTITSKPTVKLTAAPYTKLLPSLSTNLTVDAANLSGGSIEWQKDGVTIPNVTSNTLKVDFKQLGSYKVIVKINSNCIGESEIVKISDSVIKSKIFIYPNPNRGQFQVSFNNPVNEQIGVVVFDAKGAKIYQKYFNLLAAYDPMLIKLFGINAGIYMVSLIDAKNKTIAVQKVHVQ